VQNALFIAIFFLLTVQTLGYQSNVYTNDQTSGNLIESRDTYIIAAGGALSYGMTKTEAYDAKGVPDKINRLPDEGGKEMWVYECMDSDGFNEDCLYLYFDGDKLVKIERP